MAERPRGRCPKCGRDTALTPRTRVIGAHSGKGPDDFWRCKGTGRAALDDTGIEDLILQLLDTVKHLDAHIEQRAYEMHQRLCGPAE